MENKYKELSKIEEKFIKKPSKYNFNKLYIHSFGIRELRNMISKWFKESEVDEYNVFTTMSKLIITNKLPRTPLIYSLFLGIIEKDSFFVPVNEASLFDKFADIYLGKINVFPQLRTNYGYQIKAIFLEELAKYMIDNNITAISNNEYEVFVKNFSENKRKVDAKLLLEDIVISSFISYDNQISFSYNCFMFFFYAKYCVRNHMESFLIENIDKSKFTNIINYYSGLLANSEIILESCAVSLLDKLQIDYEKVDCYINKYYNNNNIYNNKILVCNKITDLEVNKEYDEKQEKYSSIEKEIDQLPDKNLSNEKIGMLEALMLLCNVLKNSECVKPALRKETLKYCLDYCVFIISELLIATEKYIDKEENVQELKENLYDFIIFLTLIVQAVISQTLGSTALIDEFISLGEKFNNNMYKFLICMIITDIEMDGYMFYLENFTQSINNNILLECTRYKLESVFTERNFNKNTKDENYMLSLIRNIMKKTHKDEKINNMNNIVFEQKLDEEITKHINNLKKRRTIFMSRRLE